MEIDRVLVAGAGTMGRGITRAIAEAGIRVLLFDISREATEKAVKGINQELQKRVEKGELTEETKDAIVSRISIAEQLSDAADAQIVIEAIIEDAEKKRELFTALEGICDRNAIFATNTSAQSISDIASAVKNPSRVIGMHFFNPVSRMKLVEVVRSIYTSDEVAAAVKGFALRLGKTPVEVRESPGFIVNRLLIPMINEAILLLGEDIASAEAIDIAMKLGAGHPMGPLTLADLIGLDVCLYIMETFEKKLGAKYSPAPLLKKMVAEGKLGRKTGRGFFTY